MLRKVQSGRLSLSVLKMINANSRKASPMAKKRRKLRGGMGLEIVSLPPKRPLDVSADERRKNRVASLVMELNALKSAELLNVQRAQEERNWLNSFDVSHWPERDKRRATFLDTVLAAVIARKYSPNIITPDGKYFRWPTTLAPGTKASSGSIQVPLQADGVLRSVGYAVGANGRPAHERRKILAEVFERELRLNLDAAYLASWGKPCTSDRLRKLANTIAAFTRNMKRRNADAPAIEDWEHDLAYLKSTYYDGRHDFAWPSAQVS